MKILHTADWHFGKRLHGYYLNEDMTMFLDWLYGIIESEEIDLLLISGDIFDVSNPSNIDREMYFSFLNRIREMEVKIIITGGNHDSVSYLNAPREYVKRDHIHVVGGATEDLADEIIPITVDDETIVICAVPFLRDRDIRHMVLEEKFKSRQEAIKFGLQKHYQDLFALASELYPHDPIMTMGHLFAIGVSTSDSERDIHIGNTGAVSARIFEGYEYVALGHIHKPQIIQNNEMIRYSGSPIPLSFSEKNDDKIILILETEEGIINPPVPIPVPRFRDLIRYSGTYDEVSEKIQSERAERPLPAFIEIMIKEEQYSLESIQKTNLLIDTFNSDHKDQIINNLFDFQKGSKNLEELFEAGTDIKDLEIIDVFEKRIISEYGVISKEDKSDLIETFNELVDILQNDDTI